jgi:hypothetical protein
MKSILRVIREIPNKGLLIVPQVLFYLGAALNQLVLYVNNGQMPVQFPGGCDADINEALAGTVHTCMVASSHLKILSDIINLNREGIWSIGDVLLTLGDVTTGPLFWCWLTLALLATRKSDDRGMLQ